MQKKRAANALLWASTAHFLCVGGVIRENSSTQGSPACSLPPENEKSHWSPHLCQATYWSSACTNDLMSFHGKGCRDLCGSQMCLQQQKQFRLRGFSNMLVWGNVEIPQVWIWRNALQSTAQKISEEKELGKYTIIRKATLPLWLL